MAVVPPVQAENIHDLEQTFNFAMLQELFEIHLTNRTFLIDYDMLLLANVYYILI